MRTWLGYYTESEPGDSEPSRHERRCWRCRLLLLLMTLAVGLLLLVLSIVVTAQTLKG